jgi:hypothetical protein
MAAPCLALVLTADVAHAGPATSKGDACREILKLQRLYLACERASQTTGMSGDQAAECSEIYYELKARAFDGDFARMRAWYDLMVASNGLDAGAVAAMGESTGTPVCG